MSILALTSDTLAVTPTAGAFEYSSPIIAATPIGTQRGIVPTQQYYRLDSALAGANVTTAQAIFGVGATVSSSTVYEFEIVCALTKSAGTTSHNFGFNFGGTASVNNIGFHLNGAVQSTGFTPTVTNANVGEQWVSVTSATTLGSGLTSASMYVYASIKGTVSINAGGTFIPQYTLSAAPGGAYTTQAGSYIRINPLSASGAATNVGTWA
jgi:hypothetical protein